VDERVMLTCGTEQWKSTSSHQSSTDCRLREAGRGLETRLGYQQAELLGLAVVEQLHVGLNS